MTDNVAQAWDIATATGDESTAHSEDNADAADAAAVCNS